MSELVPAQSRSLSPEEEAFAARLRVGDHAAFTQLMLEHFDAANRLASRLLRSPEAALDCAQTVFMRFWERHETFRPTQSIRSYVLSATHWQALKELRYQRRHPDAGGTVEMVPDNLPASPHDEMVVNRDTIDHLLELLPARKRLALHLRYVDGLSHAEIAEVLQMTRSAVERTINRTLADLRTRLSSRL